MTDELKRQSDLDYSTVDVLLAVLRNYPTLPDESEGWVDPAPINDPPTVLDEMFLEIQGLAMPNKIQELGAAQQSNSPYRGNQIWSTKAPRVIAAHYSHMFGDCALELLKLHTAQAFKQGLTTRALCYVMACLIVSA